jgi:hypothetical protein
MFRKKRVEAKADEKALRPRSLEGDNLSKSIKGGQSKALKNFEKKILGRKWVLT